MAFRLEHLHRVFGAENEIGFEAWAYATPDPVAEILGRGYFRRCQSRLKAGDLIFCAAEQPAYRAPAGSGRRRQRCLLLVTDVAWDGIETRLAQDWGRLEQAPGLEAMPSTVPALAADASEPRLTAPTPRVQRHVQARFTARAVETARPQRRRHQASTRMPGTGRRMTA